MLKKFIHKLEILWVVVTYAEAGETETALAILEVDVDHHEYAQVVR